MNKFTPTATICKIAKGDFEVVVKKASDEENVKVEKHFKSQIKAMDWALKNGYKVDII
jgi:hypothetical protein